MTGVMPISFLLERTSSSLSPRIVAIARSENPRFLARRSNDSLITSALLCVNSTATSVHSLMRFKNHLSIPVEPFISSTVNKAERSASAIAKMRRGVGSTTSFFRSLNSIGVGSSPSAPTLIMRKAFCKPSSKVLPKAITSPTDFISLVTISET